MRKTLITLIALSSLTLSFGLGMLFQADSDEDWAATTMGYVSSLERETRRAYAVIDDCRKGYGYCTVELGYCTDLVKGKYP